MDTSEVFDKILSQEDLSPEGSKELAAVLTNRVVLSALKGVLMEARDKNSIQGLDFSTQAGVVSAAIRQGEVRGLTRAIESLIEQATQETDDGN